MPTQDYRNAKGERIPGNTTVIGQNLGWSKGALMHWAWMQGKEGKDYRQTKTEAADAGTLAHGMIEAAIKGQPQPDISKYDTSIVKKACQAYDNYLEWARQMRVELVTMEVACVSEAYQVGTTVDIVAKVVDRLSIVEVKTSNDVYPEMLIQVACQVALWNETHPGEPIQACHILKLGKEEATFSHHYFAPEVLLPALEAFKALRKLHDYKKILGKLI